MRGPGAPEQISFQGEPYKTGMHACTELVRRVQSQRLGGITNSSCGALNFLDTQPCSNLVAL
ncbi:hypothetical protein I7I53_00601 [Histoplasma capsulatum var. duboisii H88]|uniref:Uncharacterized protein n=1 Tax=Ajellomyces capsulatus (strain H88) TaxID=544711 RepID=A0A8A1LIQ0_AJEC8|nr:hypothetical protein I7I53_00601 [Histoplasma capsulatum var. duboisii H88]